MPASYDPTLASAMDLVRFLLGDTDVTNALLEDEEITALLETYGSADYTAAAAARSLSARFAGQVDKAVGDLKISFSQKAEQYAALAVTLEKHSDKRTRRLISGQTLNVDRDPMFTLGMSDIP